MTGHLAAPAGASCKNGWSRQAFHPVTCTSTAISPRSRTAIPVKILVAMETANHRRRKWLGAEIRLVQPQIILLIGTMAIEAFYGRARLEDIIGTYKEQNGTILIPLAHPSGVSRWLNDPKHQKLHRQALEVLSNWRVKLGL